MTDEREIDEVALLWALPPEEFTAARDALVRQLRSQGRKEDAADVKALRKASRDAFVVNRLVATSPDVVRAVIEVGERLRAAQVQRRGDDLRSLAAERDRVLDDALRATHRLCGPLSPGVTESVRATLLAALADPQLAHIVMRGRLTAGLHYAGLGAAPLLSVPPSQAADRGPKPSKGNDPATTTKTTTTRVRQDPRAWEAAVELLREAEEDLAAAQLSRADAQQQVDHLQAELAAARSGLRQAQSEVRAANQARDAAARERDRLAAQPR